MLVRRERIRRVEQDGFGKHHIGRVEEHLDVSRACFDSDRKLVHAAERRAEQAGIRHNVHDPKVRDHGVGGGVDEVDRRERGDGGIRDRIPVTRGCSTQDTE